MAVLPYHKISKRLPSEPIGFDHTTSFSTELRRILNSYTKKTKLRMKTSFAARRKVRAVGQDDDDSGSRDGGSEAESTYSLCFDHLCISDVAQL